MPLRLWIAKSTEVPVSEQLVTQVMLAINSGELKPHEKLPSTRELARRFRIHSNTVNAAYRQLARRGWLSFRKGSGVYARALAEDVPLEGNLHLDHLISAFLKKARQQGFSLSEIRSRVKSWLEFQAPDHFLVIEPDRELRQILVAEIRAANSFPVNGGGFEQCRDPAALLGAVPVAMYGRADEVSAELPADTACLMLRSNSADSLEKLKLASADSRPIAVVSRWPDFLRWARAILLAKGVDCGLLSFRNASERGWRGGLGPNHQVVTDVLTAGRLPNSCRPVVLKVIADASLQELKRFVESFLASPGPAGAGRTRKGL